MSDRGYITLADAVEAEITGGRLKTGDRLPPQRTFAYERGIAVSTASRVYAELLRRGLVVGEVGRGTFIAGRPTLEPRATEEPVGSLVDLEMNFPILPEQPEMMAKILAALTRPEALAATLRQPSVRGTAHICELAAQTIGRGGWQPNAEEIVFTSNGKQAIASVIATLVPIGGRLGVEAITYPLVKTLAARLGVTLVPIAMDKDGVRPDAIEKAHREMSLSALYLQPVLHNPLGVSMPPQRSSDLVQMAEKLDITIVEDGVYGFLSDDAALAALAPERCIIVDSLSKRVAPGLAFGVISGPARLRERLMTSVRSGAWIPSGFVLEASRRMMAEGMVATLCAMKRDDAKLRNALALECFAGFDVETDPRAYHLWLKLPEHWRAEAFAAAAARQGIALTPSSAFTVNHGHVPNAVRIALARPPIDQLRDALLRLAELVRSGADHFDATE